MKHGTNVEISAMRSGATRRKGIVQINVTQKGDVIVTNGINVT